MSILSAFYSGNSKNQIIVQPCEDRVVRKKDYPIILPGYIANPEKKGAWHLLHIMSVPLQGLNRRVLVIAERSTIPINPHVKLSAQKIEKLTNNQPLAREAFLRAKIEALNESRNNYIGLCLVIVAALSALTVMGILALKYFQNGGKIG